MDMVEYLLLPEATDNETTIRASVRFTDGGGSVAKRSISLHAFLRAVSKDTRMTFDEHLADVQRFDVDLVKQRLVIFAKVRRNDID